MRRTVKICKVRMLVRINNTGTFNTFHNIYCGDVVIPRWGYLS